MHARGLEAREIMCYTVGGAAPPVGWEWGRSTVRTMELQSGQVQDWEGPAEAIKEVFTLHLKHSRM